MGGKFGDNRSVSRLKIWKIVRRRKQVFRGGSDEFVRIPGDLFRPAQLLSSFPVFLSFAEYFTDGAFPIFDDWKKGEKGGGNINVSIAILDVEISTIERRDGIFIVIIVIRGCHFLIEFH